MTAATARAAAAAGLVAVATLAGACAGRLRPSGGPSATPVAFIATAYCSGTTTAAGTRVRRGVVAADPAVLPLGTVIRVAGLERRYNGVYTVLDTGRAVRGHQIDLYVDNCREALHLGRRHAVVSIVRRAPTLTR